MNSSTFSGCASDAEITTYFDSKTFSIAFVNSYFDFEDYESPVKRYIDDSLFWEIDTKIIKKANFYVQK